MLDFSKLSIHYWCYKQEKYLHSIERYIRLNFDYFRTVRENNLLRQNIGLKDFTTHKLPFINLKRKDSFIMGNSTYVFNKLLEQVQKERKKLIRFKKMQLNKNYIKQVGKITFNNDNKELSIKSF